MVAKIVYNFNQNKNFKKMVPKIEVKWLPKVVPTKNQIKPYYKCNLELNWNQMDPNEAELSKMVPTI